METTLVLPQSCEHQDDLCPNCSGMSIYTSNSFAIWAVLSFLPSAVIRQVKPIRNTYCPVLFLRGQICDLLAPPTDSKATVPSARTFAVLILVRCTLGIGGASSCCKPCVSPSFDLRVDVDCAGAASATSSTSWFDKTSLSLAARVWRRIVVGPWNWRNSLSPHIVLLDHVRIA